MFPTKALPWGMHSSACSVACSSLAAETAAVAAAAQVRRVGAGKPPLPLSSLSPCPTSSGQHKSLFPTSALALNTLSVHQGDICTPGERLCKSATLTSTSHGPRGFTSKGHGEPGELRRRRFSTVGTRCLMYRNTRRTKLIGLLYPQLPIKKTDYAFNRPH